MTERETSEIAEIKEMLIDLNTQVKPIIDAYNSVSTMNGIIIGFSKFVIAIGAIFAGLIYAFHKLNNL